MPLRQKHAGVKKEQKRMAEGENSFVRKTDKNWVSIYRQAPKTFLLIP